MYDLPLALQIPKQTKEQTSPSKPIKPANQVSKKKTPTKQQQQNPIWLFLIIYMKNIETITEF